MCVIMTSYVCHHDIICPLVVIVRLWEITVYHFIVTTRRQLATLAVNVRQLRCQVWAAVVSAAQLTLLLLIHTQKVQRHLQQTQLVMYKTHTHTVSHLQVYNTHMVSHLQQTRMLSVTSSLHWQCGHNINISQHQAWHFPPDQTTFINKCSTMLLSTVANNIIATF